jgi:hypothetical protein
MTHARLLTIALAVLLGCLPGPGFAQVSDHDRALVTDAAVLESMGFPFDARNVYVRTVTGHSPEETRDFGTTLAHFSGVHGGAFIGREDISSSWQYSAGNSDLQRFGSEQFANAQVIMPTGAVLSGFRWWANDTHATADLAVFLFESCQPAFGAGAITLTVLGSADPATSGSSGNQSNFVSIAAHTISNLNCTYFARVRFGPFPSATPTGATLSFQKVRAQWNRQVSPAPAVATFVDVPPGHLFFQYVEALAGSGITSGCNVAPPMYCPDDPVTRAQMAAFVSKALGLTFP